MSEFIKYMNRDIPVSETTGSKEYIETVSFKNAIYGIYADKDFISGTGYKYTNPIAVQREQVETALIINYSGTGYFTIDLQRFLPATKKDLKTLFTAIEKAVNPYDTAEQLYNYISEAIHTLQQYRSNSNSATEKNKISAEIKKYISCCDCVCSEYGFDSIADTEVKQLPKLKKSEVYIYSFKTNSGAGNNSLYAVPGYTFEYSGYTFSIHHTNHIPDSNSSDIMQPVKGSYYTISVGGIKAYQEYKTAKEALQAFVNDSTIIDRLKKAFTSDRTIAMFNSIKEYAAANNITLPDNFFPVVDDKPETMNNAAAINQQNITSDNKPETATEAAEQTTEATEAEKPVNDQNSPKNSIPGIKKAVQFFSNIILSEDYKSPYFETLQRVYSCIYSYLYNYFDQRKADNFIPVAEYYAAMNYFDTGTTEAEKQLICDYIKYRKDYISSDREAAAFIFAYAVLTKAGIVPEQEQPAQQEQPATAVNTVYQEEQQPATAETMTGGTARNTARTTGETAGIIKAVLFYRMIIATAARNTVIPGTTARKSPKTARLQRLNALLYQYTTTAKTARIRANSKLKTDAFIVIATGNRSSPQQRNRQIVHYLQTIQIAKAYTNITELLQLYRQNC